MPEIKAMRAPNYSLHSEGALGCDDSGCVVCNPFL